MGGASSPGELLAGRFASARGGGKRKSNGTRPAERSIPLRGPSKTEGVGNLNLPGGIASILGDQPSMNSPREY